MRPLKRVFVKIKSVGGRPFGRVAAEWGRMSGRERRLFSILGGAVVGCAFLVASYLVWDSLEAKRQENEDMRVALADIAKYSEEYKEGKQRAAVQQSRIGSEPPQLSADLEAAAKEAGIQIPETSDRPESSAGKNYKEISLDVKLRKVDLKSLSTFLQKVETGKNLILITRLQIRRAFGGDGTGLDVDLTATTYEHLKEGGKKPPQKGAAPAGKAKG
jgi:hypothetical protein